MKASRARSMIVTKLKSFMPQATEKEIQDLYIYLRHPYFRLADNRPGIKVARSVAERRILWQALSVIERMITDPQLPEVFARKTEYDGSAWTNTEYFLEFLKTVSIRT